jgi:hypothetical protein
MSINIFTRVQGPPSQSYVPSWVPMQHPPVGRDFHATSAEVITEYGGLMQL